MASPGAPAPEPTSTSDAPGGSVFAKTTPSATRRSTSSSGLRAAVRSIRRFVSTTRWAHRASSAIREASISGSSAPTARATNGSSVVKASVIGSIGPLSWRVHGERAFGFERVIASTRATGVGAHGTTHSGRRRRASDHLSRGRSSDQGREERRNATRSPLRRAPSRSSDRQVSPRWSTSGGGRTETPRYIGRPETGGCRASSAHGSSEAMSVRPRSSSRATLDSPSPISTRQASHTAT